MVWSMVIGAILGGGVGFLVGRVGSCTTGACPLTSNPWIGMLYGAVVGALLAWVLIGSPRGAS